MKMKPDFGLFVLLFTATITGYNFVKYASIAKLHYKSLTNQLKSIQIFSLIIFLCMIFFIFQLKWKSIVTLFFLSIINLFYTLPINSNGKNLRNLAFIKIFLIAAVWSATTILIPSFEYELPFQNLQFWQLVQQFLFVIVLMIPFEIRDIKYDTASLKTLPQIFGDLKTKIIGICILLICILIALLNSKINITYTFIFCFLLSCFIFFSKENQSKYYASFFVEGIPVFSLILFYLFSLKEFV